jgi:hypothetical protein
MPAMLKPVNFNGGTTPTNAPTHTLATRPAASSKPHEVIFVSDRRGGIHQLSDGTTWLDFNTDAHKAPRSVDTYTVATRPTAAAAGEGKVIYVSDLANGSYQMSNGTNWATLASNIVPALVARIGVRTDKGLPKIPFVTRLAPAATVYINPTLGSDSNPGTAYGAPRQTLPGTLTAGTAYLFIDGCTIGGFTVSQNGSAGAPIVIGVYNPATGARITDRSVGRVTVTGKIDIGGRSYVALEHLNVTGGSPRISCDNSTACQLICCRANGNLGGHGIKGYWGTGQTGKIEIDGCEATGNSAGIEVQGEGGADITNGTVIQWCNASDNIGNGISVTGGRRYENCHIACNTANNNSHETYGDNDNDNCIYVTGIMRAGSSIRWNEATGSIYSCLWVQPSNGSWHDYDCAGLLIENNRFSRSQYGMALFSKLNGAFANPVLVQYNEIFETGTRDGSTVAHGTQRWGRGIEVFAPYEDETHMPQFIVCRFNYVRDTVLWDEWGTDSQGIGLDDNTRDITVYGNVIVNCGGQGIQAYTTKRPRIFANVCIGNAANTLFGWPPRPRELGQYRAEIAMGDTEDTLVFANATFSRHTGLTRYGIVGGTGAGGKKTQVHANLVCNAPVCGIVTNLAWADTDGNHFRSCAQNHLEMAGFNSEGGPIALTANDSFSSGPASTDPLVQAAAASEAIFGMLPGTSVTAVAPPAPVGSADGGALSDPNTSFIDVEVTLPEPVDIGRSIHVAGYVWSNTQATNRVSPRPGDDVARPTMDGEVFIVGGKTAPLGEVEVYAWAVPAAAVAGTNKKATIRITRQDNSFWHFRIWQGPGLAANPVDAIAPGSQSGLSFSMSGGGNTTQPTYAVAMVVHNDFAQNRAVTFTTDSGWTERSRFVGSNPEPSVLALFRELPAQTPLQVTTGASVAPMSWWHGVAVAYKLAGNVSPSITTDVALPSVVRGEPASIQLTASGTGPLTWTAAPNTLPAGMSIGQSTGIISGSATAAGTFAPSITTTGPGGSAQRTFTLVVTTPLGAPSNLSVSNLSATSQRVSFIDNASGESAIEVRRKASANGTVLETRVLDPNTTEADFTGLSDATAYFYDARAVGTGGAFSGYSNEATATTPSATTLYAQLTVEPKDRNGSDINGSTSWKVAVWTAPSGSDLVGTLVGQYTGQAFEPTLVGGDARMRVNLGGASGIVTAGQALRVYVTDGTRTTGVFAAVVAA